MLYSRPLIRFALLSAVIALLLAVAGCGDGDSSAGSSNRNPGPAGEYKMIQAELKLAKLEKPYFVIDFAKKELLIKLRGAVVWEYPLSIPASDNEEVWDFVERFQGRESQLIRTITETHLFAAQVKTPDSILAIVSGVTKLKPELLQRDLPERFQLLWGDKVILDVKTDIKGKPTDKLENTMFEVRHAIQTPFGKAQLTIKMDPTKALTLYRAAQPGFPTMIIPPKS
jgi:hypothetical protein